MKSIAAFVLLTGVTLTSVSPWRVDQGEVRVTCPMTVGGSFEAKTTTLKGSVIASATGAPAFDGSLAVDLRTLDTGIGLRNEHLRTTISRSARDPSMNRRCFRRSS
jgi:hypothetical protein